MKTQLFPVPFYDDTLVLVDQDGEAFVAMRPVVMNMGLAWAPQFTKLMDKFGASVTEIATVAEDGKLRSMVCLPLRKLPAWLYSIQPNKVKAELRDKVLRYQAECEEALYLYWTTGRQGRDTAPNGSALNWLKERNKLLMQLGDCRNATVARGLFQSLQFVNEWLGMATEPIERLAPIVLQGELIAR